MTRRPACAVRQKGFAGLKKGAKRSSSEVGNGKVAQIIEATIYQMLLLMARADALFTKDVVAYFEAEIAASSNKAGGRRRNPYPLHDELVWCSLRNPARLAFYGEEEA